MLKSLKSILCTLKSVYFHQWNVFALYDFRPTCTTTVFWLYTFYWYVLAYKVFDGFVQLNTDFRQTGAKYLCKKIQIRHRYLVVMWGSVCDDGAYFCKSFKVFFQTKFVFFWHWDGRIRHSYLVVIWGSVSNEASRVHLCWQRCRLNLYFVTLHSFPSFLTSVVSFLLEELISDNSKRLDFLPKQRHIYVIDSKKYVL